MRKNTKTPFFSNQVSRLYHLHLNLSLSPLFDSTLQRNLSTSNFLRKGFFHSSSVTIIWVSSFLPFWPHFSFSKALICKIICWGFGLFRCLTTAPREIINFELSLWVEGAFFIVIVLPSSGFHLLGLLNLISAPHRPVYAKTLVGVLADCRSGVVFYLVFSVSLVFQLNIHLGLWLLILFHLLSSAWVEKGFLFFFFF